MGKQYIRTVSGFPMLGKELTVFSFDYLHTLNELPVYPVRRPMMGKG